MNNWTPQRVEELLKDLSIRSQGKVCFDVLEWKYFDVNGKILDPFEISDRWNREDRERIEMQEELDRRLSVDRKLKEIEAKYTRPNVTVNRYSQSSYGPSLLDYAIAAELLD